MDSVLVSLPVIRRDTAERCVASIRRPGSTCGFSPDDVLVVDNSREGWGHELGLRTHRDPDGHNLGVARSWNLAAREVVQRGLDYLVILSASVEFGPRLGDEGWPAMAEERWGTPVIQTSVHNWHLIAIHRTLFEKVGYFDENFYPAYFEDTDFIHRASLAGVHPHTDQWQSVPVNAITWGSAQHQVVDMPAAPLIEYFESKWGSLRGERWDRPFGDKPLDYWEQRSIPELVERYELKEWW